MTTPQEGHGPPRTSHDAVGVAPIDRTRIVLRPMAGSGPLAFYTFGVGTILYSASQLHWVPLTEGRTLAVLLLAFVAPLQLLSGLIGFLARDAGLSTVMVVYGAVWVSLGIVMHGSPPGSRSTIIGIFLLAVSTVVALLGAIAVFARPLVTGLVALAVARFCLSGVWEINGSPNTLKAAGWLGIPILAISLYGGTALMVEETTHRTILPVARRRDAAAAMSSGLEGQVEHISKEAGVRQRL